MRSKWVVGSLISTLLLRIWLIRWVVIHLTLISSKEEKCSVSVSLGIYKILADNGIFHIPEFRRKILKSNSNRSWRFESECLIGLY